MLNEYSIFDSPLTAIDLSKKMIINTINPYSYYMAKTDHIFKEALISSDILLPDGIGIVWSENFLYNKKIKKIAGYDLFMHVMPQLNDLKRRCFFLGSSNDTLQKISNKIALDYPDIEVGYFSPLYKNNFSIDESKVMCEKINNFEPDILFVGMTAPKQEKWVYENNKELNVKIICSIGAVFDFYAGNITRPSPFWIKLGLEWLPRFIGEPIRLARRNLIATPSFIMDALYYKLFK